MNKSTSKNNIPKEKLLISYIEGKCSEEESQIVKEWQLKDKKNEATIIQLAKIYFANLNLQRINQRDTAAAYETVQKRIGKKQKKSRFKKSIFVAACLISILSTFSTTYLLFNNQVEGVITAPSIPLLTIESKVGMRSSFYLPDGSFVYLNSGGSITYPAAFDAHERRISLRGEAYFKIESNSEHPFFVDLPEKDVSIKVLGTEFNLEAYKEEAEIRTTLISGKVSILPSEKYKNASREYQLFPSQKALFNTQSETYIVNKTDGAEDIAWMEGKLIFRETPISEVLRKLSHFYDVDFNIQNKVIETYRFTGVFDNRQLVQILDYLKISSSIDYTVKQFTPREEIVKKRTVITLRKI